VIPFIKQIKAWLKFPAIWVCWCILLLLFIVLRAIIDEMMAVCFIGTIANTAGVGLNKLGKIFPKSQKRNNTE